MRGQGCASFLLGSICHPAACKVQSDDHFPRFWFCGLCCICRRQVERWVSFFFALARLMPREQPNDVSDHKAYDQKCTEKQYTEDNKADKEARFIGGVSGRRSLGRRRCIGLLSAYGGHRRPICVVARDLGGFIDRTRCRLIGISWLLGSSASLIFWTQQKLNCLIVQLSGDRQSIGFLIGLDCPTRFRAAETIGGASFIAF